MIAIVHIEKVGNPLFTETPRELQGADRNVNELIPEPDADPQALQAPERFPVVIDLTDR